jgi:clan AA aspartic protease
MFGTVRRLHALLNVAFVRSDEPPVRIEFVVDTGFTGHLTLPEEAVDLLGLSFETSVVATLADDSDVEIPAYKADILWGEGVRRVRVLATGDRPLLGTALLAGSSMYAEFVEEGVLEISPLASPRVTRAS